MKRLLVLTTAAVFFLATGAFAFGGGGGSAGAGNQGDSDSRSQVEQGIGNSIPRSSLPPSRAQARAQQNNTSENRSDGGAAQRRSSRADVEANNNGRSRGSRERSPLSW